MSTTEVSKKEMELGIESVSMGKSENAMYRPRKKKFGRTYINILHDPRVVRGNTYAAFVIPSSLQMEFMRLKEEEERRKRILKIPKKLPRVALFAHKKSKEEEYFEEKDEKDKEPDSPQFKSLDDPEAINDQPYFYEDRPPTPQFIAPEKGIEVYTQVEDGELFDFDLEVEPILQVLVGRSLVQASYELIEEDERQEYLSHKKKYEQEREFELINLQRMEAARQRREDEKKRREVQVAQKKLYDIEIQKKLIAKCSAKAYLKNLKYTGLKQLYERGALKDNQQFKVSLLLQEDYYPQSDLVAKRNEEILKVLVDTIKNEKKSKLETVHKSIVDKELDRLRKIKEDKENSIRIADETEKKRIADKAVRTENKRVNRITTSIMENIISTKTVKTDVINIPLCDIDEFKFRSENIHCLGGQLGQTLIALDSVLRQLAENNIITNENLNIPEIISHFLEELLLNQLKDNHLFELRYLESEKFDFTQTPESEEKKSQFINFLLDTRRLMNKSVSLLLEKDMMSDYVFKIFLESLANLYFANLKDPASIEVDDQNMEPEYLESIKLKQEELAKENAKLEKMKKKIRLYFVKAEDLKKKRDNVGGFIRVYPNKTVVEVTQEIEEPEVVKEEVKVNENVNVDVDVENGTGKGGINDKDNNDDVNVDDNGNQNPPDNNPTTVVVDNPEDIPKPEPIVTNIEYLNEAFVFKNNSVPIDAYILHYGVADFHSSLTVRSIRRVLKSRYNIKIDLLESITKVKERVATLNDWMFEYILHNEKYMNKTIIPLEVKPEEPVKEADNVGVDQDGAGQDNNGLNSSTQNQNPQDHQ